MRESHTNIKPKNFGEYLKNNLTTGEYDLLPITTGISRHKLTKIENNARVATAKEARILSVTLGKRLTWLMEEFKIGYDVMTIAEAEAIRDEEKEAA
ncbi:MAG: hypothetical protein K9G46_06950 [Flavobacteriales bacterium]|nr:hypothetical protein [Flavobacteriales bacterium]